jgi:hypothetical protein
VFILKRKEKINSARKQTRKRESECEREYGDRPLSLSLSRGKMAPVLFCFVLNAIKAHPA